LLETKSNYRKSERIEEADGSVRIMKVLLIIGILNYR